MNYIDIHTHKKCTQSSIAIINVMPGNVPEFSEKGFFSTGIHPWYIKKSRVDIELNLIEKAAAMPQFIAIGEAGLDKFSATPIDLQKYVFKKQIEISERHNKPLIIHCVRMYNELIRIKKEILPSSKWIIHGYNSNIQTTNELLRHGFYLSAGESIMNINSKIKKVLPKIPADRLFLESDDSNIDISEIYRNAASVLKIEEEVLGEIIENNFKQIFG